jgi:hypothetical protein
MSLFWWANVDCESHPLMGFDERDLLLTGTRNLGIIGIIGIISIIDALIPGTGTQRVGCPFERDALSEHRLSV